MSYKTGFYKGRLGIGLSSTMGMGDGNPRYPLDINGDIRLTGSIVNEKGKAIVGGGSSGATMAIRKQNLEEEPSWTTNSIRSGDGNVGIGIRDPQTLLHISNDSGDSILRIETKAGNTKLAGIEFWTDDSTPDVANNASFPATRILSSFTGTTYETGYLKFQTHIDNTTAYVDTMTIKGPNVGIGTMNPQADLHIHSETSNYKSGGKLLLSRFYGSSTDMRAGAIWMSHLDTTGWAADRMCFAVNAEDGNDTGNPLNKTPQMVLKADGNVGIGTTSPNSVLELSKSLSTEDDYSLMLNFENTYSTYYDWSIGPYSNNGHAKFSIRGGANGFNNLNHYFTVHGNGNVGIGTTTFGDTRGFLHLKPNAGIAFQATTSQTNSRNWRIRPDDYGPWGNLGIYCGDSNTDYANHEADCVISFTHERRIGIGTISPSTILTIKKPIDSGAYGSGTRMIDFKSYFPGYDETTVKASIYCGVSDDGSLSTRGGYMAFMTADGADLPSERMRIERSGNVGIGTDSPGFPLEISGDVTGPYIGQVGYMTSTGHPTTSGANNDPISLKTSNVIWSQGYILASSDRRIKENIVDVSDNFALEMVRNIPVKYYEYKDKLNKGTEKTIGFIAQEVKEQLPIAVSIQKNIIPNEMRILTNISWDNNKLITDLQDVSGIKYRFYVSNDPSGNDECIKEIVGNLDNTFSFDTSYNNVFCYGKKVDDFHTLDKQKLFALNFSATQELDKKVTSLETENQELKTKVASLESELALIKQHLGL